MAHTNRIRILVLHDDPVARAGIAAAFQNYHDLEVVHADDQPADTSKITVAPSMHSADVVVTNYETGVALTGHESRRGSTGSPWKIVILTARDREWEIRSAIERGVRGYMLAGCGLDELAHGVRAVHWGARHLSPQAAQRLADSVSGESLTGREEEVLRLVVEGLGNKAIARRLSIAVGTVKSHLKGVFDKLGVESRTQAICSAARRGLLQDIPANPVSNGVSAMNHGGSSSSAPQMSRSQSQQW